MAGTENLPAPVSMGGAIMPAEQVRAQGKAVKEYLVAVREFVADVLVKGIENDYGEIPGTKKLTLLQPGADKLCGLFSFVPKFVLESRVEDPATGRYDVRYRCELYRGEVKVGEAVAFASSFESKWRYRFGSRTCPSCGKETVRKGKSDKGGGFYCWAKLGGCGATFKDGDPEIVNQEIGKIQNVDIVDVFNTVEQVCQKRAKVAAVRNATRLTDMFTQDVGDPENQKGEDYPPDVPYTPDAPHTTDRKPTGNGKPVKPDLDPARQSKLTEMEAGMFWAAADKVAKGHAAAIAHVQTAIDTLRDSGKLPPTCWGWQEIANDAQAEAVLKALGKKGDK